MADPSPAVLERLREQRHHLVHRVLWVALGIVSVAFVLNAFMLGRAFFAPDVVASNALNFALIGVALWLNHRRYMRAAVWLIIGVTLFSLGLSLLQSGISGNLLQLYVYFIPVAIAGVLLGRRELYLTTGVVLASVLAAPLIHGADLQLEEFVSPGGAWSTALQFSLVIAAVALILDRIGIAFQSSLHEAVRHEAAHREGLAERLQTSEALREEQDLNSAIVENLPGIFYVLDDAGKYHRWNRNFSAALGYDPDDMPELDPLDLIEESERPHVERSTAEVFESGSSSTAATLVTKHGRRVPYLLNRARVTRGPATYLVGIGIDRSDIGAAETRIQRLNEELQERVERLTSLHEIDRAITGSLDLSLTLNVVLEQITQRLHVDAAAILLYRSASQSLRFGASHGFNGTALRRTDLRLGAGLAGRAALDREPIFVNDPAEFRAAFADASSIEGHEFVNYVAFPLVAKGELQGVLELFHRSPIEPDDDWNSFLVTIATQAAIAIDSTRMFHDLQRSNQEMRLAYDSTIEGWARALDLKDEDTEGHSRRVTELTVRLAERLGMSEEEIVHVRRGALLHDIGKMGVPDSILRKPGKLDSKEWELMKKHTTFARDFLTPIPFLRDAIDIPYAHHEKWDGSGYPNGLSGTQIPLAARLFAVVDVYDALTSDRPYREAWSEERTLAYIREQRGAHFDPAAVDAFLDLLQADRAHEPVH